MITLVYGTHKNGKKEYCWRVSEKTTLPEDYVIQKDDLLHVETVNGIAPMRVARTEEAEENEQTLIFSSVLTKIEAKKPGEKKPGKKSYAKPKKRTKKHAFWEGSCYKDFYMVYIYFFENSEGVIISGRSHSTQEKSLSPVIKTSTSAVMADSKIG